MSEFIEKFKKYSAERKSLFIPELNETIYWTPLIAPEQEKIARLAKHAGGGDTEYGFRLLIEKAEDAEGKKLFTIEHMPLLATLDITLIGQIVAAMTNFVLPGQAEKN